MQLPADVLVPAALAAAGVIVAKLASTSLSVSQGFPARVRLQHTELQDAQLRAELELLGTKDRLAEARARYRKRQLEAAGWEVDRVVVTDDHEAVL
jgi:hypothetical protein